MAGVLILGPIKQFVRQRTGRNAMMTVPLWGPIHTPPLTGYASAVSLRRMVTNTYNGLTVSSGGADTM